ncbi:hypothetical protein EKO04_008028 [Ascochyta lentis]|uniref:Uncharacterized protein n=1 Tax=Ascochyta lentis TaxID=205686 RepID=A0A8H7IXU4_9PLEO|nr:hypothetical protein EKO04_008028 [Ascochyta lentis]
MSSSQDTSRHMYRLASLYNGAALVQLEAMHWQTCRKPREEVPLFGPRVSESRKRTAYSVNQCVAAIDFNTAWLAFCIEGLDFDIEEVTFEYPKPTHEVELWLCGSGCNERQIVTKYPHTILKLIPNNKNEEAVVADATYAQYSFDDGIDTYNAYCATKVYRADGDSMREELFGRCFEDYAAFKGYAWEQSCSDAAVCTTNNVMFRELSAAGGVKAVLSMGAEEYQRTEDSILAALKQEMEELRLRLEWIYFGDADWFLMQLANVVMDADGAGHQACMQSYRRRNRPQSRASV